MRLIIPILAGYFLLQACAGPCVEGRCQVATAVESQDERHQLFLDSQRALAICVSPVDPEFVGRVRPGSRDATESFRSLGLSLGEVRLPSSQHDPAVIVELIDHQRNPQAYFLRNGFGLDVAPYHLGCALRDDLQIELCGESNRCNRTAYFSVRRRPEGS